MKILFIGGRFENRFYDEIIAKTKTVVDDAGNTFQTRLIQGLKETGADVYELSAPYIGAWPTVYKDIWFKGFSNASTAASVEYVTFNNIWGYRNLSRAHMLKKAAGRYLSRSKDENIKIIVYAPHTPCLEAAVYIKKKAPTAHVHLVVPDLPQYMNPSSKKQRIYHFFKAIDIKRFQQLQRYVDSYTLLTKPMAQALNVSDGKYIVVEGLVNSGRTAVSVRSKSKKTVLYAGKLYESFGVKNLAEAFMMLPDPDARLIICGGGELKDYITAAAQKDSRIEYRGVVPVEQAHRFMQQADVLVNPRQGGEEYTKYSFPSKNIEYLQTGNAVVSYMLEGIPKIYQEFFFVPKDNTIESLSDAMQQAFSETEEQRRERIVKIQKYFEANCTPRTVAERIIEQMDAGSPSF